MEPLLSLDGISQRTRSVSWSTCLLWFILAMQCATFIMLLVLILNVAPIVPDITKVIRVVDTTLYDIKFMLPEMNGTLWDLNHILPGIKKTIYYTEAICEHTKALATAPYLLLSYTVTLEAVARPYIHDFIHLEHDDADAMIAVLVALAFLLCFLSRPNYDLLCKRIALLALLKGTSQALTIVPQPNGVDECVGISFWQLKSCADMMFSGHTSFTYLVLYKTRFRKFFTFAMAFELVMAKWHYMSDCFMACIAGYAIEKYLPDESYL